MAIGDRDDDEENSCFYISKGMYRLKLSFSNGYSFCMKSGGFCQVMTLEQWFKLRDTNLKELVMERNYDGNGLVLVAFCKGKSVRLEKTTSDMCQIIMVIW